MKKTIITLIASLGLANAAVAAPSSDAGYMSIPMEHFAAISIANELLPHVLKIRGLDTNGPSQPITRLTVTQVDGTVSDITFSVQYDGNKVKFTDISVNNSSLIPSYEEGKLSTLKVSNGREFVFKYNDNDQLRGFNIVRNAG